MSELKSCSNCAFLCDMYESKLKTFESHAVEVLAQQIGLREACAWGDIVSLEEFKEIWERGSSDKDRDKYRAEARALLGIQEGE